VLKKLGVPPRDAQVTLARLAVGLETCTREDRQAQREARLKVSRLPGTNRRCKPPN
jgi:hypothetical protein